MPTSFFCSASTPPLRRSHFTHPPCSFSLNLVKQDPVFFQMTSSKDNTKPSAAGKKTVRSSKSLVVNILALQLFSVANSRKRCNSSRNHTTARRRSAHSPATLSVRLSKFAGISKQSAQTWPPPKSNLPPYSLYSVSLCFPTPAAH